MSFVEAGTGSVSGQNLGNIATDEILRSDFTSRGLVGDFALSIGASEPALRLLLSIIIGYPLAILHRYLLYGRFPAVQHLYFIVCGLLLGYFNYGVTVYHNVLGILGTYILIKLCGGTVLSIIISIIFNMGYLLCGYYFTESDNYDIKWTMSHCVLALRLIGLTYDVFDATNHKSIISTNDKSTVVANPTLLEVVGHSFFFGGYLVGPQFPMTRYLNFVNGYVDDKNKRFRPNSVLPGLIRGSTGLIYIAFYQVASAWLTDDFMLSEAYGEYNYLSRFLLMTAWGKIVMYKYVSCWLVSEGVCILSGIAYSGRDDSGNETHTACSNVRLLKYETCTKFNDVIESFNVNTNLWVAKYIFKRLKFMNNRIISHVSALFFLALWHGFHSGYYNCFALEFVMMKMEKELEQLYADHETVRRVADNKVVKPLRILFQKVWVVAGVSYSIVSFSLLTYDKYLPIYSHLYFYAHVVFGGWVFVYPVLRRFTRPKKSPRTSGAAVPPPAAADSQQARDSGIKQD